MNRYKQFKPKHYKLLGKLLREERKLRHITQIELAEQLGISQPHLSKIENGVASMTLECGLAAMYFLNDNGDGMQAAITKSLWDLSLS